jgi:putative tricarboxylic transport membrane protein
MSDTPSHAPVKSIMPKWVRGPQDFVGGIALIAIALFALWASSDLQGMRGFSFGAGTAPRMFAYLLLGLGIAVTVVGLVTEGAHLAKYHWRGPLFVSLAIVSFAVAIRPLGLVVSAFAAFLIAAMGTHET